MFYIDVSEKIRLQILTENDADKFLKLINKNKDHLKQFMPRIMETENIDHTKKVIKTFLNQLIDNNGFRLAIYYNSHIVGVAGLKYIDWLNKKTEIMYWIDQDYAGKGIVTDCVNKLIDIAFYEYKLNKVIIKSSVENIASNIIAEKCKLVLEGVSKQDELLFSGYTDINMYSLLRENAER